MKVLKELNRKDSTTMFGTWFSIGATSIELLERCNKQIETYKNWLANINELKKEIETEIENQRKDELRKILKTMSKEEVLKLIEEEA